MGLQNRTKKLQKIAKLGRYAQTIVPYAQLKPTTRQIISGDSVALTLAESMNLPEVLASNEEVNRERQQTAAAQQQNQQNTQAETDAKLAQAQGDQGA